jgi:hypothetical protein
MRIFALVLLIACVALWLIGSNAVLIRACKRLGMARKSLGLWLPAWISWGNLTGHERLKIVVFALLLCSSFIFLKLVYAH